MAARRPLTGGTVGGEVDALPAGRRARLQLGCTVRVEGRSLVIVEAPYGLDTDELVRNLEQCLGGQHVADVRDESSMRVGLRIVCPLGTRADRLDALDALHRVWPATVELDCRLPAPQRRRLRTWDAGDCAGLRRLADLLGVAAPPEG